MDDALTLARRPLEAVAKDLASSAERDMEELLPQGARGAARAHPAAPRRPPARAPAQRAREATARRRALVLGDAPRHPRDRDGLGAAAHRAGLPGAGSPARSA